MAKDCESYLARWISAGVLDADAAERIRAWEKDHADPRGLRWPVLIALAFGAILLGAGVLLFVSSHWDEVSPATRMFLVVAMTGVFHAAGAVTADHFESLSVALHAVGTVALGAGIALAGQIFNLSEHWPTAVLMWAAGATAAWAILRHWTQAALTAILVPFWLSAEWSVRAPHNPDYFLLPISAGLCALSFAYLGARRGPDDSPLRKALGWLGGLALLPAALTLTFARWSGPSFSETPWVAWSVALLGPLAVAAALRGREIGWNAIASAWCLGLAMFSGGHGGHTAVYLWSALGATGLAAWGIRDSRPERINLGIAGFAVTVLMFYFSSVMDKMGRSTSLIVAGLLFLVGGWLLERTRRGLIARIRPEAA